MNFFCMHDEMSVQALPPPAQFWPGEPKAIVETVLSEEIGLEILELSCGHETGGLLFVMHLGCQNGTRPGSLQISLTAKPISEMAYL